VLDPAGDVDLAPVDAQVPALELEESANLPGTLRVPALALGA
jgi:hypothetical protein